MLMMLFRAVINPVDKLFGSTGPDPAPATCRSRLSKSVVEDSVTALIAVNPLIVFTVHREISTELMSSVKHYLHMPSASFEVIRPGQGWFHKSFIMTDCDVFRKASTHQP
jgi:hypothetical protein